VLAAASSWRGDTPRPEPERTEAETLEKALREVLGQGYAVERAAGAQLSAEDVLAELDAAVVELG
ncbi:hypothetical protein P8605_49140, partial [Streptomyces sp. T-3]|nr:hypothetical protein [Streptomyces sp. T-3]